MEYEKQDGQKCAVKTYIAKANLKKTSFSCYPGHKKADS